MRVTATLVCLGGALALCGAGGKALGQEATMNLTVEVDFGKDLGQSFGSLFEATDAQGRVLAGAGFPGLYNTAFRNDRHALQFFIRPAEAEALPGLERLPRFSTDTGVYIGDLNGRLIAKPQYVERRIQAWDPQSGRWSPAPEFGDTTLRNGDGQMHLGEGLLRFIDNRIEYDGKLVLAAPEKESIHHVYYAMGHLFFFHDRGGQEKDGGFTRVCALPWVPGQTAALDLGKAFVQPTWSLHETTWAWGQLKGKVLTVTNWGGIYAFDGTAWKTLRTPDGKSCQVYSMLNYYDRLLLGHYPSGSLYEYDGETVTPRENWPPQIPGVVKSAREAQSMALYRGELYAGVWPWAEVWRYDRHAGQWLAIGRLFTRPPVTDKVGHPFEAEIVAYNTAHNAKNVGNDWGQRATSLAAVGDALYLGTSNKGGSPRPPDYTFIDEAQLNEYGQVLRLRVPGQVTGQVTWVPGPTTFRFVVTTERLSLWQDGHELAGAAIEPALAAGLKGAKITWGKGVFGPLAGTLRRNSSGQP